MLRSEKWPLFADLDGLRATADYGFVWPITKRAHAQNANAGGVGLRRSCETRVTLANERNVAEAAENARTHPRVAARGGEPVPLTRRRTPDGDVRLGVAVHVGQQRHVVSPAAEAPLAEGTGGRPPEPRSRRRAIHSQIGAAVAVEVG